MESILHPLNNLQYSSPSGEKLYHTFQKTRQCTTVKNSYSQSLTWNLVYVRIFYWTHVNIVFDILDPYFYKKKRRDQIEVELGPRVSGRGCVA